MTRILAPAVLVALAIAAAPAQAHTPKPKPHPKADRCTPHRYIGFDARGLLVSQTLTQTAGAGTATRADDRYSGTLTVDVKRANHRAPDGVQTYTLDNDRVRFGSADPKAGDRVKLHGKLARKGCDPALDVRRIVFKEAR
jgi:hypothetical protein